MRGSSPEGQRSDKLHFPNGIKEMYCSHPFRSAHWGNLCSVVNTSKHIRCLYWENVPFLRRKIVILNLMAAPRLKVGTGLLFLSTFHTASQLFQNWGYANNLMFMSVRAAEKWRNVAQEKQFCWSLTSHLSLMSLHLQSLATAIAATKVLSAQQVVKNEAGEEVMDSWIYFNVQWWKS